MSASDLVNALVGQGVQISNVQSSCADRAAGTFTSVGDVGIGLTSGVILSSGAIDNVVGPNNESGATKNNQKDGDPDLDELITGYTTHDVCSVEFDFVTQSSVASFKYVFASEEYNEYVNSSFNDVFGFFIDNVNCATIDGSNVSINNVNGGFNDGYYVNNDTGAYNIEMDGITRIMTCSTFIQPNVTHHLKLAIADAGDSILDSNVFIGAESFVSSDYAPSLSPNTLSKGSGVDNVVTYELDLMNLGSNEDSFNLTLSNSEWQAVFASTGTNTMTIGPLSSLNTAKVTVYVSVPVTPTIESDKITVTATSFGAPTKTSTSYLITKLSPVNLTINQTVLDSCPTVKAYVTATDLNGAPLAGLTSADFTVREDGKPRTPITVSTVGGASSTLSVAMTLDYSNSMVNSSYISPLQTATTSFINQVGASDAVEVIKFSTAVEAVQSFTTSKPLLATAVTGAWSGSSNDVFFYDAVYKALTDTSARPGRRAVIAMSGGEDTGSAHSIDQVITYATALGIPVYTVGIGSGNASVLMQLATATRGKYFNAPAAADLQSIYTQIAGMFQNQYEVAYPSGFSDGTKHSVQIRVTKGKYSSNANKAFTGCSNSDGAISGTVVNATTKAVISGASITLSGPVTRTATTNASGSFSITGLPAGGFSLQVSASGFIGDTRLVNVTPAGTTSVTVPLSPVMSSSQYRAVLSWGASPQDLDLYAYVPTSTGCYLVSVADKGSRTSSPYAALDVDDTSSYGPETITIQQQHEGAYQFWVHNYSGANNGDADITTSTATVNLYNGSVLAKTVDVPTLPAGRFAWHIFDLKLPLGHITTVNTLGTTINGSCTETELDLMVTYHGNGSTGGTVPVDNTTYHLDSTVTVAGNTGKLTRPGYAFVGWNTSANGSGTSYDPGATFTMGYGNVKLYAQWFLLPTYTVSYAGNGNIGGTIPVDSKTYNEGTIVTAAGNPGMLTRAGYSFTGWNTAADGSGTSYAAGTTFAMGAANLKLYAQWMALPTYVVTYSGNGNGGGTVPVDSNSYYQNATVMALGNTGTLTRTGYTFAGWNTAADGSGTNYSAGTTFIMGGANVTLHARWLASYSVTYSGNGNTGGMVPLGSSSYLQNTLVTVLGNSGALARTGYTFAGWNTADDGSGTSYAAGSMFAVGSADVTLYARWLPSCSVAYSGNGSTGGMVPLASINYLQGTVVKVLGNAGAFVRTGYTFAGWNTAADGSGTDYAAGANFVMGTTSVTLHAKWIPIYIVGYSGNGSTDGTVPVDSNSYLQSATVTVLGNTGALTRTGYVFAGWNTAANGSGTTYAEGASFAIGSANVTLYAQWTALPTFTVTYHGNGNTGGMAPVDSKTYLQGATVTVSGDAGTLIRTGYAFAGWNTAAGGSGTSYAAGSTFVMGTTNVILYARWTADSQGPTLLISTLADGAITNGNTLNISGTVTDNAGIKGLSVNGMPVAVGANGAFSYALSLTTGSNLVTTIATDNANNSTTDVRSILLDPQAPVLTVTAPADNSMTRQNSIGVTGTVNETSTVSIKVNNDSYQSATMNGNSFGASVNLTPGSNTISIRAVDLATNVAYAKRTVLYDDTNPDLAITEPGQDMTISQNTIILKGTVSDSLTGVTVSISMGGQSFTPAVIDGSFQQQLTFTTAKQYAVTVTATDEAGNTTSVPRNVIYAPPTVGDPTGDGKIEVVDALLALQYALNLIPHDAGNNEKYLAVADLYPLDANQKPKGDGKVDVMDALLILQRAVYLVNW